MINDSRTISAFGTKFLGDARHPEKIFQALKELNVSYRKIIIPEQIHSTNISVFELQNPSEIEKLSETDGVITKEDTVVLTVITGDCVPMIFSDKKTGTIGISHQGWRGTLKKMVRKMINKMQEMKSKKEDIFVAIGPSIGVCCYDISDDRYYTFMSELDGYSGKIFFSYNGKRHLNIPLLNYLLLTEAGIPEKNIDSFPFCTKCDAERFFSFRRDGKKDYGEMLSFIVKRASS
ncbi:peptidoglycan editing factor PgeF [Candidatus Roizmanbacteria bacterium]|nr:peptidoglycan editing factor PgeF [Candidatus Roizmanbacteria bacterium]